MAYCATVPALTNMGLSSEMGVWLMYQPCMACELRVFFICSKGCKTSKWTNNIPTKTKNKTKQPATETICDTYNPKTIILRPFVEKVYRFPEMMGKSPISPFEPGKGSQKRSKRN